MRSRRSSHTCADHGGVNPRLLLRWLAQGNQGTYGGDQKPPMNSGVRPETLAAVIERVDALVVHARLRGRDYDEFFYNG